MKLPILLDIAFGVILFAITLFVFDDFHLAMEMEILFFVVLTYIKVQRLMYQHHNKRPK